MTIQEIKNIQISDFLASRGFVPTNKKGSKWWYLSPLHAEHTASFKVDLNKNVWYDFGLSKGGNILDLAMELYHTQCFRSYPHDEPFNSYTNTTDTTDSLPRILPI